MSNQAENNQKVQTIELTEAQFMAICAAKGELKLRFDSVRSEAEGAKSLGMNTSSLDDELFRIAEQIEDLESIKMLSTRIEG